jgi:GT2 family glycosyltransferase
MQRPAADVDLCVVVVNYCTPAMLIDCLETLVPQVRQLNATIALVDNASPDDSVEQLKRWISETPAHDCVKLIESKENGGFAAGNNIGMRSCNAKLYLLLNSDTLLREGALQQMVNTMASEKEVALLSPRLEWPNGEPQESCFRYHRPLSQLIDSAGTAVITRLLARYVVPQPVSEGRVFPEWTSFACILIRRDVFDRVGLLDDGFFMYFEDVEFSFRARHAGFKILHEPAARVVHLRGGSSPVKSRAKLRKRLPRYFYESRTRYFYKLYGRGGLLAANLCWTLGWTISSLRRLMRRSYQSPVCKAQWRDIWINFWTPMALYTHPEEIKHEAA